MLFFLPGYPETAAYSNNVICSERNNQSQNKPVQVPPITKYRQFSEVPLFLLCHFVFLRFEQALGFEQETTSYCCSLM